MQLSDQELVARARSGEGAALELLITRALPKVRGLARKLAGDAEEGDALAQEGMVAAMEGLGKYRGQASFATWVCSITLHKHVNAKRREAAARRRGGELAEERVENPGDLVEGRDTAQRLLLLVAELPASLREAILAHATADTPAEAASSLGLGAGAFRVRLHRARLALRERMRREYPEWTGEVNHAQG